MPSDKISPLGRDPKPKFKAKGKKKSPAKLKASSALKPLDVVKVALEADAGSGSSRGSKELFKAMMRLLSKAQLSRLEKLIQTIQNRTFEAERERQRELRACRKIRQAIERRNKKSAEAELSLKLKIQKKLQKLPLRIAERTPSGKASKVAFEGEHLSFSQLMERHLKEEVEMAARLLEQGVLIRQNSRQRPHCYVKKIVEDYLERIDG